MTENVEAQADTKNMLQVYLAHLIALKFRKWFLALFQDTLNLASIRQRQLRSVFARRWTWTKECSNLMRGMRRQLIWLSCQRIKYAFTFISIT